MTIFTDVQARNELATVLREARNQGEVRIRAQDGQEYTLRPVSADSSPFAIAGVDLGLSAEEIVKFVQEGRQRQAGLQSGS